MGKTPRMIFSLSPETAEKLEEVRVSLKAESRAEAIRMLIKKAWAQIHGPAR